MTLSIRFEMLGVLKINWNMIY